MNIDFNDAQQAMGFLAPQMLRINTEIEMAKYPAFDYASYMFVDTSGDRSDIGSLFYSGDIAGVAKFLNGKANDMPFADIATSQHIQENHIGGIGYEWSLFELERAAKSGRNLGVEKADAARRVAESFIFNIAMRGSTEKNMSGLINSAAVPTANVPNDGTGASRLFDDKTADQVLRDVNACLNAPFNATRETQRANTLLLPTTRLQRLAERRVGDTESTVLDFLKKNNSYTLETGQPLNIKGSFTLETAGVGGTARMVAYENEKGVVRLHLPAPHEFLPAFQTHSTRWEVAGFFNVGGVEFRRPKGAAYRDGI